MERLCKRGQRRGSVRKIGQVEGGGGTTGSQEGCRVQGSAGAKTPIDFTAQPGGRHRVTPANRCSTQQRGRSPPRRRTRTHGVALRCCGACLHCAPFGGVHRRLPTASRCRRRAAQGSAFGSVMASGGGEEWGNAMRPPPYLVAAPAGLGGAGLAGRSLRPGTPVRSRCHTPWRRLLACLSCIAAPMHNTVDENNAPRRDVSYTFPAVSGSGS